MKVFFYLATYHISNECHTQLTKFDRIMTNENA